MTMHITPSRPSMAGLNETTAVRDWQARRYGQTSIPASSMVRLEGAPQQWNVSRFGETEVMNWDVPPNSGGMGSRRTWKRKLPESSLLGIGSLGRHTGTPSQRRWGINPLSETTYVENTTPRRAGMQRFYDEGAWHEQASLSGFGALGATLDTAVSVRDLQLALRKLGICRPNGSLMVADGVFGPITSAGVADALRGWNSTLGTSAVPAERAFQASNGASEIRMSSAFWTWILTATAGRIDQCSTGGGGGGGSAQPEPTPGEEPDVLDVPEEAAWYESPTNWLLIAAAGVAAYFVYDYATKPVEPELPALSPDYGW